MTKLLKAVVREGRQQLRGLPLVVRLDPAGYVEVWRKGLRERHRQSFEQVFLAGAREIADEQRAERARERRRNR